MHNLNDTRKFPDWQPVDSSVSVCLGYKEISILKRDSLHSRLFFERVKNSWELLEMTRLCQIDSYKISEQMEIFLVIPLAFLVLFGCRVKSYVIEVKKLYFLSSLTLRKLFKVILIIIALVLLEDKNSFVYFEFN